MDVSAIFQLAVGLTPVVLWLGVCLGFSCVQGPMLTLFTQSFTAVEQYKTSKEHLVQVLEAVRLLMRMFFSLNWQVNKAD